MDKNRRGFITAAGAVSAGVFVTGLSKNTLAGVEAGSILVAMPGGKYYAIPSEALSQYEVSENAFVQEERRRLNSGGVRTWSKGGNSVPMGVRG